MKPNHTTIKGDLTRQEKEKIVEDRLNSGWLYLKDPINPSKGNWVTPGELNYHKLKSHLRDLTIKEPSKEELLAKHYGMSESKLNKHRLKHPVFRLQGGLEPEEESSIISQRLSKGWQCKKNSRTGVWNIWVPPNGFRKGDEVYWTERPYWSTLAAGRGYICDIIESGHGLTMADTVKYYGPVMWDQANRFCKPIKQRRYIIERTHYLVGQACEKDAGGYIILNEWYMDKFVSKE